MKRRLLKYGSIVAAIAFLAVFYGLAIHNTPGTEAVKATDFNPGRIIVTTRYPMTIFIPRKPRR